VYHVATRVRKEYARPQSRVTPVAPSPVVNCNRREVRSANARVRVRSSAWEGERGAEVEHAQPAEVPLRDARHSDDVAGACVAQDNAGERRASPPSAEHGVGAGESVEVDGDDAEEDAAGAGHAGVSESKRPACFTTAAAARFATA
jgi:hypothetical protein